MSQSGQIFFFFKIPRDESIESQGTYFVWRKFKNLPINSKTVKKAHHPFSIEHYQNQNPQLEIKILL